MLHCLYAGAVKLVRIVPLKGQILIFKNWCKQKILIITHITEKDNNPNQLKNAEQTEFILVISLVLLSSDPHFFGNKNVQMLLTQLWCEETQEHHSMRAVQYICNRNENWIFK